MSEIMFIRRREEDAIDRPRGEGPHLRATPSDIVLLGALGCSLLAMLVMLGVAVGHLFGMW